MNLPKRKNPRLQGYDYSQNGAYFVTICAKDKAKIFGNIVGGGVLTAPMLVPSVFGEVCEEQIHAMNEAYENVQVEKYVIMPNHIHLLIHIRDFNGAMGTSPPTNVTVPQWVSTFKRFCSRKCGVSLFQRSFHDHIIRNEAGYQKIWEYIDQNPAKWQEDTFYVE